MHILAAGGSGYIGSVLVPQLLEHGHRVTVLDRLYFGDTLAAPIARYGTDRLRIVRQDVRTFDTSLLDSVDVVVDLAGISNDPSCDLEPEVTQSVNVGGTKRLAAAAQKRGVRRYIFSSSCSVYGHGEGPGLVETSPRQPVSLYARTKAETEEFLFDLARQPGSSMDVTCLRLATVFGLSPRMRFDLAVNVMTKNAYVQRRITVDGGGRQWRPFVHVRDAARAFELALTGDRSKLAGEVFNVGADSSNIQVLNLAFRVRDAIPGTEIVHAPTDPDLRDYNVSFEKIRRVLDFRTEHTIDDGIREILGALREGGVDPDERRWYTLKQYVFLREAERAYRDLALDGKLLSVGS
jgi:nucleoside-diphosphate-sugar epimerase